MKIHDEKQIESLELFLKKNRSLPYDQLLNQWMCTQNYMIDDPDTMDYYIDLLPLMERSLSHE